MVKIPLNTVHLSKKILNLLWNKNILPQMRENIYFGQKNINQILKETNSKLMIFNPIFQLKENLEQNKVKVFT